jgi:AcrR family transcriptional regulator
MPKVSAAHRDARRTQILDAAARCFARDGFHAATMEDVLAECGLSAGAVYRYFRGKVEIVEALARERHLREREALRAGTDGAPLVEELRALARRFFAGLDDPAERAQRRLGVQIWAEALRSDTLLQLVRHGLDQPLGHLRRRLRQAQARGELSRSLDVDATARALIALFQGFLLQQAWDPSVRAADYLAGLESLLDAFARLPPAPAKRRSRRRQ